MRRVTSDGCDITGIAYQSGSIPTVAKKAATDEALLTGIWADLDVAHVFDVTYASFLSCRACRSIEILGDKRRKSLSTRTHAMSSGEAEQGEHKRRILLEIYCL